MQERELPHEKFESPNWSSTIQTMLRAELKIFNEISHEIYLKYCSKNIFDWEEEN